MRSATTFLLVLLSLQLQAQVNIGGDIEKGYRDFVQQTRSIIGKTELSDFAGLGGEKRFFSNHWEKGAVKSATGTTVGVNYSFNYDFLDKQLYALFRDTVIVIDNNYVSSFHLLKGGAVHYFIKIPALDNTNFMESIGYDSTKKDPVQLVKNRTAIKVKGDKTSYAANFNGEYADQIKEKSDYYLLFPDGTYIKVKLDKKDLSAALEKYHDKAAAYFNSVKKITEDNLPALLAAINS